MSTKAIKQILKDKFSGINFSVRERYYGIVVIDYYDGPLERLVESEIGHFEGINDSRNDIEQFRSIHINRHKERAA